MRITAPRRPACRRPGTWRSSAAGRLCAAAVAVVGLALLAATPVPGAAQAVASEKARIDAPADPAARMVVGWTHERWSPDRIADPERAREAERVLKLAAPLQNANIQGWGMPAAMPAPDRFDFKALDARVAMMERTARWRVITLCCAPEWMKPPRAGEDERTRFEQAPRRDAFPAFAALAARIAARYPQVSHFLVWNELKGFWDASANRWDAAAYTELYNQVWKAVKAVRPDAQIGGPYVVLDSFAPGTPEAAQWGSAVKGPWGALDRRGLDVVEHWLKHKAGADFIVLDASVAPKRGDMPEQRLGIGKFVAAQQWVRQRTALPLWWAEFYPSTRAWSGPAATPLIENAVDQAEAAGAAALLFWNPVCRGEAEYGDDACLWREDAHSGPVATELASRLIAATRARLRPGS